MLKLRVFNLNILTEQSREDGGNHVFALFRGQSRGRIKSKNVISRNIGNCVSKLLVNLYSVSKAIKAPNYRIMSCNCRNCSNTKFTFFSGKQSIKTRK